MMTFVAVFCCAMTMLVLTACTNDISDNPVNQTSESVELAEATILWYGTGSGNVDEDILDDFRSFYTAKPETYGRVNIVAQYKASVSLYGNLPDGEIDPDTQEAIEGLTEEELEDRSIINAFDYFQLCHPQRGATYRFVLDPKKTLRQQFHETEPYGEYNSDFTCPDSLTNFINWAAKNYPAKKYILVMADHGGGFFPAEDLPEQTATRGLIYDDGHLVRNDKKCFSGKSLARGVKNANIRLDAIIPYICLMNNLEFLYELKDVTDYIACSTYVLWKAGSAFDSLADNLAAGLDTKTALANYVDDNMDRLDKKYYKPQDPENPKKKYYDLTLTETARLNDLAPVLREFTDRLCDAYKNGTQEQRAAIDFCTMNAVKVHNTYPFYDMAKYLQTLFSILPEVFDADLYQRLSTAFNACIVKQRYAQYLVNHDYMVDYSVLLGTQGTLIKYQINKIGDVYYWSRIDIYLPDGTLESYRYRNNILDSSEAILDHFEHLASSTWPSTFADTYQQTTFDRLVGWSRWILLNEAAPAAWSPASFNFDLPEEDMSEIPIL